MKTNEQTMMGVTVVVPTLLRSPYLADLVEDLLAQTYRPLEILVVDQSGSAAKRSDPPANAHPDIVRYHRVCFRGLPRARNYGWQMARYEAILFLDDDTRCPPNLVEEHLKALSLPGVGIVAGAADEPDRPRDADPPIGRFNPWTAVGTQGFASDHEGDVDHAKGCNFSVWRHVIREAGGVDEGLTPAASLLEDLEFCVRVKSLGYRVYFCGKARVTHLCAPTGGCRVAEFTTFLWGMTRNRVAIIRRHLRWYQKPVAYLNVFRRIAGFARAHRAPSLVLAGLKGYLAGIMEVSIRPTCTTAAATDVEDAPASFAA